MKYVYIDQLREGDIIAKAIEPYIKKDTPLNQVKIDWLRKQGKKGVYVKNDFSIHEEFIETVPEQLQQEAIRSIYGKDITSVIDNAKNIVGYIEADKNIKFDIWSMIDSDFDKHPIHVCEFALAVAKKMGYRQEKMLDVALAALLHDIGKNLNIDEMKQMIYENKSLIISMNENIEKNQQNLHTIFGYGYLKKSPYLSSVVKNAILYHHENENGTGLFGKKGDEIKEIASLIHLCDDYELALRKYEDPITARDKIRIDATNGLYNVELTKKFLSSIPLYPIGTVVVLSDGTIGSICEQNYEMFERPVIVLNNGAKIDLDKVLNLTITELYGYNESYQKKL